MLNIILMLSGNTITIAAVALVVSVLIFFALRSKKKKVIEPEFEQESTIRGPEEYVQEKWDENLFTNWQNNKIRIRIVKVFSKTEDKDKLIFASSLPFHFVSEDRKALKELIPELIEVSVLNSHELMLAKSPASHFSHLQQPILTHLFTYLNKRYVWMTEKTTVSFHYIEQNELNCHLRYMTRDHARLGVLLGDIPGITNWLKTVAQMENKDTCQFDIQKELGVEWIDLLPKIQKVFRSYFTGGVEFIGPK